MIFQGEGLTYNDLVSSAAVPPLFRAVKGGGRLYWDGLFASNPPVRELTNMEAGRTRSGSCRSTHSAASKSRAASGRSPIAATSWGNLSLGQELYFVQKVNQMLGATAPSTPSTRASRSASWSSRTIAWTILRSWIAGARSSSTC